MAACGRAPDADRPDPVHAIHESTAAPSGASLYDLEMDLQTSRGSSHLDLHRGHPVVVAMFYASCKQVCPMTIAKIQGVESKLSPADRARLRVLLVSLDPERDTVPALEALSTAHALDERWTLARVGEEHVRELSAALGIQYKRLPGGEINHSTAITLLDGSGVARSRIDSLGAADDAMVASIRTL
jgi:protein SCO1/2